jgi:hypothetical protein
MRARLAALLVLALPAGLAPARGDEVPREYHATIDKGLAWLKGQQAKDGHWEGVDGKYAVSMTALAGMALLCEGSTVRDGKYRHSVRRARDWLMKRVQPLGLIGDPRKEAEGGRYMYGHGFALLFLSCVVGDEEDGKERKKLNDLLEKAAKYSYDAQTKRGGWGYLAAKDGKDKKTGEEFDEGSVTITQMQALRAARNAGIAVPSDAIREGLRYLKESTDAGGGVRYRVTFVGDSGRPALTAAALCCGFSAGEYQGELVKKWLKFCQRTLSPPEEGRRMGHDEYTQYYYAQVVYVLGEDRYRRLFPNAKDDELITWKEHRAALFEEYKRTQCEDGSWSMDTWTARRVGPVYVTACYLTVLQLDKGALPIYQR